VSERAPPNVRRRAVRGRQIDAPIDPLFEGDDSPLPGSTTTTVRPPGPKARGPTAPARPPSRFGQGLKLTAGVCMVLAASISVAWAARRYVTTSPRFAVRTVLVEGERKRSATQVASAGGVAVGKNIFALDLAAAGQMLMQDPWIEKATVTRKLPSTISIAVVEREAAATVAIGGELYLATRDGELFKKLGPDDPSDLPLLTGFTAEQVARDRPGVVLAAKRTLDVAEDLDRSGINKRYPTQELHIEKDGSLVVTVGKEAISLHLGLPPYRDKIEQASRVLFEVAKRKANASVLFLDNNAHPERVVVRMR
jgi:cell division protein FtsQ